MIKNEYEKIIEDSKKATDLDPKNRNIIKHVILNVIEQTGKGAVLSSSMMQPIYTYMKELEFDSAQISFWFGSDAEVIVREIQNKKESDSFRAILKQYKFDTSNENKEKYNAYQDVYIKANNVVSNLKVDDDEKDYGVAHYTRKWVSEKLLFNECSNEECPNSILQLSSISGANDPKEGKTLIDYFLGNTFEHEQNNDNSDRQAFISCFTFNHNHLNQFRLYGKEDDKECTGLSLVLKDTFFANQEFLIDRVNKRHTLYRCVYIDPKSHNIISVGQRDEYTFYTKGRYSEYEKEAKFIPYKEKIIKVMEKTKKAFSELEKSIKNVKKEDLKLIPELLINLRYLVKHSAFKEEQECRIIRIEKTNHSDVKKDGERKYVEATNIRGHVKKIYFGPCVMKIGDFKKNLKKKGLGGIICEKSGLPYHSNKPKKGKK